MNSITSHDEVRNAVAHAIITPRPPNTSPLSLETLYDDVAQVAHNRNWQQDSGNGAAPASHLRNNGLPYLHAETRQRVIDIVWDMIVEGLLRPCRLEESGNGVKYLHITDFGKTALKTPETPYDPELYLKRLREKIPLLDAVIFQYVTESMETMRRHCLLSSTITLGCASEKAVLLLYDAFEEALNPTDQATFQKAMEKHNSIKPKQEEFLRWYDKKLRADLKKAFDNDWLSGMEQSMTSLFSHFRMNRNAAGHPTGTAISREEVHAHLVVFPRYLERIYDLINWLGKNKPLP